MSIETLRFGRRLRRPGSGRIPVTIFTGFLGAGKTSLVRRLIETPEGAGAAIIVNEFGEIGFDQDVLTSGTEETVLLGNGCLCCTMRTDLQETLRALFIKRQNGEIAFNQIIIETSGLADPGPILQTFISDRALGQEFHLRNLVGVADAVNFPGLVNTNNLARKQIALSDTVVITKTDLSDPAQADAADKAVREALAGRQVPVLRIDNLSAAQILTDDIDIELRAGGFFAEPAEHESDITSFPIVFDKPLPWEPFVQAIRALTQLRGQDLLRVKGVLDVQGCEGPVHFHAVQHLVHEPVEVEAWPDGKRRSQLIFITRGISRAQITSLLAAMIDLAR